MVQYSNRATCQQSEKDGTLLKHSQNLSTVRKRWYNTQSQNLSPVRKRCTILKQSNSAKTCQQSEKDSTILKQNKQSEKDGTILKQSQKLSPV